jgi:hypothetical protein
MLISPAFACDCARRMYITGADLVFVGVAKNTIRWRTKVDEKEPSSYSLTRYVFSAERTLKGPKRPSYFVDTDNTDCGFHFEKGKRYTVYAKSFPDDGIEWHTSVCSLTSAVSPSK